MADDTDLYLEPKRRLSCGVPLRCASGIVIPLPWRWQLWLILGIAGLLLAAGGLALALGVRHSIHETATEGELTMTLVPTFTPRPRATDTLPPLTLSARPWTDDSGPVGLVEVILSLPAGGQVNHELPPGFRYWRGDLLQTRQGLAWSGNSEANVHWYLLREPGATLPATLEVRVNGQVLAVSLQPATLAVTSVPVE